MLFHCGCFHSGLFAFSFYWLEKAEYIIMQQIKASYKQTQVKPTAMQVNSAYGIQCYAFDSQRSATDWCLFDSMIKTTIDELQHMTVMVQSELLVAFAWPILQIMLVGGKTQ